MEEPQSEVGDHAGIEDLLLWFALARDDQEELGTRELQVIPVWVYRDNVDNVDNDRVVPTWPGFGSVGLVTD